MKKNMKIGRKMKVKMNMKTRTKIEMELDIVMEMEMEIYVCCAEIGTTCKWYCDIVTQHTLLWLLPFSSGRILSLACTALTLLQ